LEERDRVCVGPGEAVIVVVTVAEGGFRPNRAICRHRISHRMGNKRHMLSPRQPCLKCCIQTKNAESAASRVILTSFTVPRRMHSVVLQDLNNTSPRRRPRVFVGVSLLRTWITNHANILLCVLKIEICNFW